MEKKKKRFLSKYSVFDIIIIAMCASLGIAIKPVLVPLVHIITGPLFIPGGAVAGGFYMLFIALAAALVKKPFSATLTCLVQAILVIVTGVIGSHGIMSIVTYVLPGILVDAFLYPFLKRNYGIIIMFFAGMIANITGSFLANVVFFRLPFVPLMMTLFAASVSGGLGGILAYYICNTIKKVNPALARNDEQNDQSLKNKTIWIIVCLVVLIAGTATFAVLNNSNIEEKKASQDNAIVTIVYGENEYDFDLNYLMDKQAVNFSADLDKDGEDAVELGFTGVALKEVLSDYDIKLNGDENISFVAADGYTTVCNGEEVLMDDNIYLVYKRNGEFSGKKEDGGTGPIEIIIRKDQFSQRWCKFLMEINIK